jgi:hypothetical protein
MIQRLHQIDLEALGAYADRQHPDAQQRRHVSQPEPPWPAIDNVMLRFLIAEALELATTEPTETVTLWLAVHAWFEGGLAEIDRARTTAARNES